MKTKSILLSVIFITGCATNGGYQAHHNTGQNTIGGAAAGAGIYALTALLLGADVGTLAGVGALHGGVTGAGGSIAYNANTYKTTFIQCMRDRNYQAY